MSVAMAIYQAQLDAVSAALWADDYAKVADLMSYPHMIANHDAEIRIETHDQLIAAAREFRASLVRIGTTDYHRTCVNADFVDDAQTVIEGEHLTYALRSGTYAIEPMVTYMTLKREGTRWLGSGIRYIVHNRDLAISTVADAMPQAET